MAWDEVKERLNQAATPREKQAAAEALARHIDSKDQDKRMVTLQRGGLHVVRLGDLPQVMIQDPEVYDRVRKVVTGR